MHASLRSLRLCAKLFPQNSHHTQRFYILLIANRFRMKNALLGFLFLFLFQWTEDARASHAMGAEIQYTCLGNNQYLVTVFFYRDCFGIAAPAQMDINITSSCYPSQDVLLDTLSSTPTQISTVCPTELTTCQGGIFTGIEEWKYQGIVTLPGTCADWILSHSESARNAALTTITGAGSDILYFYTLLNNTNGICNNSPSFESRAVPFACVGQQFCYSNSASDSDGDSLYYELVTPLTSSNTTVTYLPGYSYLQPLLSNPPVAFSSSNGFMCMVPMQPDVTVFAVLVSEFRNGILIGQIERDVQLTINNCNNNFPQLTGVNGTPSTDVNACPNIPLNFNIYNFDADNTDNTSISWDNGIPAASFTVFGNYRPSATFNWTPTTADVSSIPYCFSATVRDDHCPYFGTTSTNYCITVLPMTDIYCRLLGINTIENEPPLFIFPNPSSVEINLKPINTGVLIIFDSNGKIIFQTKAIADEEMSVDVSHFAKGIYQVLVNSRFLRSKGRFIVQ